MKYIFEGFDDSLSENAKKGLLLYGDPHFDINKTKFILLATLFYITLRVIIIIEKKILLPYFCVSMVYCYRAIFIECSSHDDYLPLSVILKAFHEYRLFHD